MRTLSPLLLVSLIIVCVTACDRIGTPRKPTRPAESPTRHAGIAPATKRSEKQIVDAIRSGQARERAERDLARIVKRVDGLNGHLEFDHKGHLTGVDLAGDRLHSVLPTAQDVDLLLALPHLVKLRLYGDAITNDVARRVGEFRQLADLTLHATAIDDDGIAHLEKLGALRRLDLSGNVHLTDVALVRLEVCPNIEYLALRDGAYTGKGIAAIQKLSELRAIDLRGCVQIGATGLAGLVASPRLESLKVGGAQIDDLGLKPIGRITSLTDLTIEDAGITDTGLAALHALDLTSLSLARCFGITDAGLAELAAFSHLQRLALRDLAITGPGLAVLSRFPDLRQLGLNETMIDDEAMIFIQPKTSLERLKLRQTQITAAAAKAIVPLKTLRYLDVQDTGLTDGAGEMLANSLTALTTLVLASNAGITDRSVPPLCRLSHLILLDVRQTGISADGARQLTERLKGCHVLY